MARSFSEDGAISAGAGPQSAPSSSFPDPSQFGPMESGYRGGGGFSRPSALPPSGFGSAPGAAGSSMPSFMHTPDFTGGIRSAAGLSFSTGGAIDTGDSQDDSSVGGDDPMGAMIEKALGTVGQVLSFGRKRHGLGGSGDDGAIPGAQTAARMPTYPGNQSESGVRQQPPPGPLPPTPNPFGKRADASDQDSGAGAIDTEGTDEETT